MARIGSASAKSPSLLSLPSSALGPRLHTAPPTVHTYRPAPSTTGFAWVLANFDTTVQTLHATQYTTGHYWTLLDWTLLDTTGHYCAGRSFTSDSRRSAASSRSRSVRPDSWRVRRLRSLSLSPSCPACASRWPRACTARRGPCGSEARRGSTRACGGCRGGVEARVRRCRCKAGACGDRAGGPQCLAAQASVRGQVGGAYLVLKVVLRHLLSVGWMSIMKLLSDSARRTAHSPRMSRST